jgi:hypothetical protein
MEISKNSAGLGIPRGGVKNLNELSSAVQQQGFATAKVHTAPVGVNGWHGGGFYGPGSMSAGHAGGYAGASAAHASASTGHSGGAGGHR